MMAESSSKAVFAEKGMRLVRSWEILMLLAESPTPLGSAQINEMVHRHYPFSLNRCSVQTTNEDLKTLQKCGFPICRVDQHDNEIPFDNEPGRGRFKNTKWCLRDSFSHHDDPPIPFLRQPTASDVLSISLCRALLKDELPSQYPFRRTMAKMLTELQRQIFQKLRQCEKLDPHLQKRIQHLGREYIGKSVNENIWDTVVHAIALHQVVQSHYKNREGKKSKITIVPLSAWFSDGRAYLLATDIQNEQLKVWRLDRFSPMTPAPHLSAPQVNEEDIDQAIRQSFKGYVATPVKITLKVQVRVAYLFREFKYHESQQVQEHNDGSLTVTMKCATGWGFEEWMLGFGEFVTVLEPETLRCNLQQRINKMATQYQPINEGE